MLDLTVHRVEEVELIYLFDLSLVRSPLCISLLRIRGVWTQGRPTNSRAPYGLKGALRTQEHPTNSRAPYGPRDVLLTHILVEFCYFIFYSRINLCGIFPTHISW